ncbi:MAG: hypothetical protein ABF242_06155 [Flavobacteriales bacterium]
MEAKETAKLAKKIILGKEKPAPILRFLCWFTIIWDSLIALWMAGSGVLITIKKETFLENEILKDFTSEFCFVFAFLHAISLLSTILMYRKKRIGFSLYVISNIAMLVALFIYIENFRSDYLTVTFTLVLIGLFATRLKKMV